MAWILFMGTQNILISSRFVLWPAPMIFARSRSIGDSEVEQLKMQALPIKIHYTGLIVMKSNANARVADQNSLHGFDRVWSTTLAFALLFMMNFWSRSNPYSEFWAATLAFALLFMIEILMMIKPYSEFWSPTLALLLKPIKNTPKLNTEQVLPVKIR